MHEAKEATQAQAYTRQLYTALGVGRSSTKVRRPMVNCDSRRSCPVFCNEMNNDGALQAAVLQTVTVWCRSWKVFLLTTSLAKQRKGESNKTWKESQNPTGKCFNNIPSERPRGRRKGVGVKTA